MTWLLHDPHSHAIEPALTAEPCSKASRSSLETVQQRCEMGLVLLIILILLVIGAFPSWPYSSGWGYYPSGGLGLVLLIVLILVLLGRI